MKISEVTETLNTLTATINAGKSHKIHTFIKHRINADSSISVYSTKYYYGGEGHRVGRGAWMNVGEKVIFKGKPRKVKAAVDFLNGYIQQ